MDIFLEKISIFFEMKKFLEKSLFFSPFFFEKNFHLEKNVFSKNVFSMSIRNFPKIPKIALRKSCDECKHAKNAFSEFHFSIFAICAKMHAFWYHSKKKIAMYPRMIFSASSLCRSVFLCFEIANCLYHNVILAMIEPCRKLWFPSAVSTILCRMRFFFL